jgi:hypothetical protein
LKIFSAGLILFCIICLGCRKLPNGSSMDREEARLVCDAFLAALQADRVDEALGMMEPELFQSLDRTRAESLARSVFDYCERPGHVELRRDETGVAFYADGRAKPMRRFFYVAVGARRDGDCTFAIEVVPGEGGMRVGKFSALKPG